MYDKDFAELVKIAAEKLKEDTVYKMLTRSEDYQKESDERDKAERNYEQLDLTMEQRKVCDVFLDYRDRQSLEYSDYSYLAGLYDAFRIMAVIFPDRWDMDQIQKALSRCTMNCVTPRKQGMTSIRSSGEDWRQSPSLVQVRS